MQAQLQKQRMQQNERAKSTNKPAGDRLEPLVYWNNKVKQPSNRKLEPLRTEMRKKGSQFMQEPKT